MKWPTGPIATTAPWGSFNTDWSKISRWDAQIVQAAAETGAPADRIAAHIVIESQGNPAAIQKNDANGWSYGLLQVVARWHKPLIERLAGREFVTFGAAGEAMITDPLLAVRAGAHILKSFSQQHGSWDRASSAFFLGNPNWVGEDTVNGNTGPQYQRALNSLIAEIAAAQEGPTVPTVQIAGLPTPVALDVPFRVALMPRSQTNQRPGTPMRPSYYTQHDTGNRSPGANAEMHRRYMANGAEGQQLGYHFTVDDREAIQMVPVNEIAWHAGDGGGPGNMTSVACELCINSDINEAKSRENAAKLAAAVMGGLGLSIDRLVQHNKWSGKNCPQDMRGDGYWPAFVSRVSQYLSTTPPPTPPAPRFPDLTIPEAVFLSLWPRSVPPDPQGLFTQHIIAEGKYPKVYGLHKGEGESWLTTSLGVLHAKDGKVETP